MEERNKVSGESTAEGIEEVPFEALSGFLVPTQRRGRGAYSQGGVCFLPLYVPKICAVYQAEWPKGCDQTNPQR